MEPLHPVGGVPLLGLDQPAIESVLPAEVFLGKRWPSERDPFFVADQDQAAVVALLAEGDGGLPAGQAGAHDHDRPRAVSHPSSLFTRYPGR